MVYEINVMVYFIHISFTRQVNCFTTELHCMRNFSSNNQCGVVEELACFQYSLNDKNSNYKNKQNLILNILVSSHLKFYTSKDGWRLKIKQELSASIVRPFKQAREPFRVHD